MYGGFGGLGGCGGIGGYGAGIGGLGGAAVGVGGFGGSFGVGAIATGTLILIALGVVFVAGRGAW